jgi:hypothetical protein
MLCAIVKREEQNFINSDEYSVSVYYKLELKNKSFFILVSSLHFKNQEFRLEPIQSRCFSVRSLK